MLSLAGVMDFYGVRYSPSRTRQKVRCLIHDDRDPSMSVDLEKGVAYCVTPEHRVLTRGLEWRAIGEVQLGDELVAFDEHLPGSRRRQWREAVVQSIARFDAEVVEVELASGAVLTCTPDHRWLVTRPGYSSHWMEARDLLSMKSPASIIRALPTWDRVDDAAHGFIAGALDCDGWLTNGSTTAAMIGFTQRQNATLSALREALRGCGYGFREYEYHHSRNSLIQTNGPMARIHIRGRRTMLQLLGECQPPRLIEKLDLNNLGRFEAMEHDQVVDVRPVGVREVVAVGTSTGTFLCEGLASHNCHACHWGGTALQIVMTKEGIDLAGARKFATDHGLPDSDDDGSGRAVPGGTFRGRRVSGKPRDRRGDSGYVPTWLR